MLINRVVLIEAGRPGNHRRGYGDRINRNSTINQPTRLQLINLSAGHPRKSKESAKPTEISIRPQWISLRPKEIDTFNSNTSDGSNHAIKNLMLIPTTNPIVTDSMRINMAASFVLAPQSPIIRSSLTATPQNNYRIGFSISDVTKFLQPSWIFFYGQIRILVTKWKWVESRWRGGGGGGRIGEIDWTRIWLKTQEIKKI